MTDSPIDDIIADDTKLSRRGRFGWLSTTVAVLFGLLFAYDLWEALGNLLGIAAFFKAAGLEAQTPWVLLVVNLAAPLVAFLAALFFGRRKSVFVKVVLFAVALSVVAVISLDATALL